MSNIRGPRDPAMREKLDRALDKPITEWSAEELNWAARLCVEILRGTDDVGQPLQAGLMNLALDALLVVNSEAFRRTGRSLDDIPWREELRSVLKGLKPPPKAS